MKEIKAGETVRVIDSHGTAHEVRIGAIRRQDGYSTKAGAPKEHDGAISLTIFGRTDDR